MHDDETFFVVATIEGPFGEVRQLSAGMRLSEAAVTIASLMPEGKLPRPAPGALVWLTDLRILEAHADTMQPLRPRART